MILRLRSQVQGDKEVRLCYDAAQIDLTQIMPARFNFPAANGCGDIVWTRFRNRSKDRNADKTQSTFGER